MDRTEPTNRGLPKGQGRKRQPFDRGAFCRLAVAATAAAKGLAALPSVTFKKGRARTPLRAGAGTANRQMRPFAKACCGCRFAV